MVRILDPDDRFFRRLGLVMQSDVDRVGVWIDGHDEDFVHWVARSLTEVVPGTWHKTERGGEWFVAEEGGN